MTVAARSLSAAYRSALLVAAIAYRCIGPACAEGCPGPDSAIAPDRGDVTNSSVVVPADSLQSETGLALSAKGGARSLAVPVARLRYGALSCGEILVDLPSYVAATNGRSSTGFSDLAPAVKWQLGPLPGEIDLSVTAGLGLPTGAARIAGRGVQPYLQFPWSHDFGGGWSISGMETAFFLPAQTPSKRITESTFAVERDVGENGSVFVEYAGDFPSHAGPSHSVDTGGAYRLTPRQQIDVSVAFGLNRMAPSYAFGIGYSIRFDEVTAPE
jgi:hypothetical protein